MASVGYKYQIQTEWMCDNCFVLWFVSGSEAYLACVWHKRRMIVCCWSSAAIIRVVVADGKPWVSMLLSRNEFTMLTYMTFLAF